MQKFLWFSLMIVFVLGSCIPATVVPSSLPDEITTYTPTFTITPIIPTNTVTATPNPISATSTPSAPTQAISTATTTPSLSEAYLSEIHMMDKTEGWAWASIESKGAFFLLHTNDGGLNWEDASPNIPFGTPFFLDGRIAWVAMFDPSTYSDTGLLQTTDGGVSWKTIILYTEKIATNTQFGDFSFQDSMNGWLRAGDVSAGSAHMYYYQTNDGGVTWTPVILKAPKDGIGKDYDFTDETSGEIVICHVCYNHFYFDLRRAIFSPEELSTLLVTSDFGETWHQVELPDFPSDKLLDDMRFNSPIFFNEKEGVLPILIRDLNSDAVQIYIYATRDNGLTWELESEPTVVNQFGKRGAGVEFISRLDGFIITQDDLSVTHDGGKTWTVIFKGTGYTEKQINFVNPRTGWIILKIRSKDTNTLLDHMLLKTTDGGLTWNEIVPVIKQ